MSILVNDNGIYKEPAMILVNDGGIWKEVGGGATLIAPGDPFGGGFYLGALGGHHHIIADVSSEASLAWGGYGTVTSATSTTDSTANTDKLVNSATSYPAAEHCRNYRGGGFDDWDLPARDVLNLFWLNLAPGNANTPAAFKTGGAQALTVPTYYWSSTEHSASYAWGQSFSDGNQLGYSKASARLVRPVRRLKL